MSNMPLALAGASEGARAARSALDDAAKRRDPVLLVAEAGLWPADAARLLHGDSRPGRPLVTIACAGEDPRDLEAALFGSCGGRVEGEALEGVDGASAIAQAADGTLVLDSIEELPASAQRRLSRILRDAEVRLPGTTDAVAADFRLVASTAIDLDQEARDGRFRHDLLRRLSACRIVIPPLRQRVQDIPELVTRLAAAHGYDRVTFTEAAMTVITALPWTRNIEELSAFVQQVLVRQTDVVRQEDVLAHLPMQNGFTHIDFTASLREARRRFERDYIAAVLERHQWRMAAAARTLGIERANLYRKTRQLGISRAGRQDHAMGGR